MPDAPDQTIAADETIVVTIASRSLAEVIAGPGELIALADNNPRPIFVEAKVAFHGRGNLDGGACIRWRSMRYGQDRYSEPTVVAFLNSQKVSSRSRAVSFNKDCAHLKASCRTALFPRPRFR
jgi:hypothetical protein